jgi:hypothetical protein
MSFLHWLGGHKQGFSSAGEQPNLNTPFARLKKKLKATVMMTMTVMAAAGIVNTKYNANDSILNLGLLHFHHLTFRRHIHETDTLLTLQLQEHRHNLNGSLQENPNLAEHAYEESCPTHDNEAEFCKWKLTASSGNTSIQGMSCLINPTSQPNSETSPMCFQLINK